MTDRGGPPRLLSIHLPTEVVLDERIACPFCGERNVKGSNICGRCLRSIREVANPEREDYVETAKTANPNRGSAGWLRRLLRWWRRRGRRAE